MLTRAAAGPEGGLTQLFQSDCARWLRVIVLLIVGAGAAAAEPAASAKRVVTRSYRPLPTAKPGYV